MSKTKTSWGNVSNWYSENVGERGSYFHDQVIFPFIEQIWKFDGDSRILDLGCGEGVLSRRLKNYSLYQGVDVSNRLLEIANEKNRSDNVSFSKYDISKPFELSRKDYTHVSVILALQNVENPSAVLENAAKHLIDGGELLLVLNHPVFRTPKSTAWGIDADTGFHYRKVYKYMSSQKIRIDMHPGSKERKEFTYSYHHSISEYSRILYESGFRIEIIQELVSNKVSEGKNALQENFIRNEIPMFMCIIARKFK